MTPAERVLVPKKGQGWAPLREFRAKEGLEVSLPGVNEVAALKGKVVCCDGKSDEECDVVDIKDEGRCAATYPWLCMVR